jgi:hypothetical protein
MVAAARREACSATVPLLDDEAVAVGHLEARRDADALYLPPRLANGLRRRKEGRAIP